MKDRRWLTSKAACWQSFVYCILQSAVSLFANAPPVAGRISLRCSGLVGSRSSSNNYIINVSKAFLVHGFTYSVYFPYGKITLYPHVAHMCSYVSHMCCYNFTRLPTCDENFPHVRHMWGPANICGCCVSHLWHTLAHMWPHVRLMSASIS